VFFSAGLLLLKIRLIMAMAFFHAPVEYDFGGKSEQFAIIKESGKRQGDGIMTVIFPLFRTCCIDRYFILIAIE
jgi:hypothetical protein